MSGVLTATEVANVLTFVAPGFFALAAYRYEFPRRTREGFYTLAVAVATSVPLVALTNQIAVWLGVERNPLGAAYVALLLVLSVLVGYAAAQLRGWRHMRCLLRWLGVRQEPEDSPFLRAVRGSAATPPRR